MSLAFVPASTTSPEWTVWSLVNTHTVEFKDGPREVPGEIYGSVLVPASFSEEEARAAFHEKKAEDAAILDMLDRLAGP
jgi:hypothetical protein